jgi:hypothetical protein
MKPQRIFKSNCTKDFTVLPNAMLRDKTLSFKARGLLAMVLSNTGSWEVTKTWLEEQGTEGRDAMNSALKELMAKRYVTLHKERDAENRFARCVWEFYDTPQEPESHNTGSRAVGNPSVGNPDDGEPATKKNNGTEELIGKKKAPLAPDYPLPVELDTPEMQDAWKDWQQHRREKRQPITPTAAGKQLGFLCGIGTARALAALRHSTASGYQGIFEPKGGHTPPKAQPKAPVPFVAGVENFDGTPWTDPTST